MRNDLLFYHLTLNLAELFDYKFYTVGQNLAPDFYQRHWRWSVLPVVAEVIEPPTTVAPEYGLLKLGFKTEAEAKYFQTNYAINENADMEHDAHFYEYDCCF